MSLTEASLAAATPALQRSADKRLTFKFVQSDDEEENDDNDFESDSHCRGGESGGDITYSARDEGVGSLLLQS